jgi:phosphoglycerol transferase
MNALDRLAARLSTWRWFPYALAALFSLIAVWFGLDLWNLDWRVPLYYSGDALAVGSHFKTIIETGWFTHQPDLGAPYGQFYNDYPQADNLHFIAASLLRVFTSDFGALMNIYFVIGFPLAAITAVWFLRLVGVSRTLSVALGVVFSIAPYHFIKGEGHLFLAAYFVVPLALGVLFLVATGKPIWSRRILSRRNLATGGILVLLGTASSYYSVFVALVLAVAGLAKLWQTRSWRRFFGAAAAGLVIASTMFLNLLPDLLYRLANGANEAVLVRSPPEAELYSFKIASLLLPVPGHRFGPFANLRQLYDTYYPLPSEAPALGLIAGAGFVALVVFAVYFLLTAGKTKWRAPRSYVRTLAVLSGLTLVAFLFGTVGGLSTLLSFIDFPIRSWNRIAILIAMLALAAVGLLLDRFVRRLLRGRRRADVAAPVSAADGPGAPTVTAPAAPAAPAATAPTDAAPAARASTDGSPARGARRWVVAVPLALVLMVLGVWDQIPPIDREARTATVASYTSDDTFTQQIESTVESGCLLYQLPYIAFPESPPVNGATDSDELRMFLHSTDLRWSAGGIKGRAPIDEVGAYASLPVPAMLMAIRGIDACGVVVDRAAYADGGGPVVDQIRSVVGESATSFDSADGRFTFIDVAP